MTMATQIDLVDLPRECVVIIFTQSIYIAKKAPIREYLRDSLACLGWIHLLGMGRCVYTDVERVDLPEYLSIDKITCSCDWSCQ